MSYTARDIPDLSGRVAVVTGANSGLGLATTRALAAAGAHVVMAVRDLDKAARARDDVLETVPEASLELVRLDLAEVAAVDEAADTIRERHDHLDLLVNNAGVMATPETRTPDGFELQLATNHLGHFVLTARLLPALARGTASRVVSVTSFARMLGTPVGRRDPHLERFYEPWWAYGRSKLANAHFGIELHRRLAAVGAPVASLVAHPGLAATDLQARGVRTVGSVGHRFWHAVASTTGMPPERGALPQLRAGTDPGARSGEVYAPRYIAHGPPVRRPVGPWMGATGPDAVGGLRAGDRRPLRRRGAARGRPTRLRGRRSLAVALPPSTVPTTTEGDGGGPRPAATGARRALRRVRDARGRAPARGLGPPHRLPRLVGA